MDKRTCYAGDLTSDALGKTIHVLNQKGTPNPAPIVALTTIEHQAGITKVRDTHGTPWLIPTNTHVEVRRSPEGGAS